MANSAIICNGYKEIILDRASNVSPTNSPLSIMRLGGMDQTPGATDLALDVILPKTSATWDALDATTGWTQGGDGGAVTLNTTTGERKEGTGCINLPITYSAGTAEWYKTMGSISLTNKYILFYLYISTTAYANLTAGSNTLRVILGTSGYTNVNNYDYDKAHLVAGWNLVFVDCSNAITSTGGSGASLATIDRLKFQLKSGATSTTNNIRLDWIHYCSSTDFNITLSVGYPVLNYSTFEATYRGVVGANEMNGYDVTNSSLENNDATMLHGATIQFTAVTKTNKIIMAIQPKIKIN